jgi:hypothetical protein
MISCRIRVALDAQQMQQLASLLHGVLPRCVICTAPEHAMGEAHLHRVLALTCLLNRCCFSDAVTLSCAAAG